jgi:putative flippase GtrA
MRLRAARFTLVGLAATALHAAVALLTLILGWAPGLANLAGFLCAFWLGFTGHLMLTFVDRLVARVPALLRYGALSLGSFALGQSLILTAHRIGDAPPAVVQLSAMALVAALNYALSTAWAFRGAPGLNRPAP